MNKLLQVDPQTLNRINNTMKQLAMEYPVKSQAELAALLDKDDQQILLQQLSPKELEQLQYNWKFWGRPKQQQPSNKDWREWWIIAGRGYGKTRLGVELLREKLTEGRMRIALVASTPADARDIMIEGESGIMACFPEDQRPLYEPSKRKLTFYTGATALVFSGANPEQLRGPQYDFAWCDELCAWEHVEETWDMLMFGLRLGKNPQVAITTTPKPLKLMINKEKEAKKDNTVIMTRGSTKENTGNLAAPFLKAVTARYEGTRLGRQELDAEILVDIQGALWTHEVVNRNSIKRQFMPSNLGRIVVAVDPAVTSNANSDDTGIVVAGEGPQVTETGRLLTIDSKAYYVLKDCTLKASAATWAAEAVRLYHLFQADAIVAEVNQGGDLVELAIKSVDNTVNVRQVRATRGKHIRAEPVASLTEQDKLKFVGDDLEELKTEITSWSPLSGEASPNRMDALVWAITDLAFNGDPFSSIQMW